MPKQGMLDWKDTPTASYPWGVLWNLHGDFSRNHSRFFRTKTAAREFVRIDLSKSNFVLLGKVELPVKDANPFTSTQPSTV